MESILTSFFFLDGKKTPLKKMGLWKKECDRTERANI